MYSGPRARTRAVVVAAALVAGLGMVATQTAASPVAASAATNQGQQAVALATQQTYEWKNVEIVGGGFVPGFVFNATEPDLIYARTDIGGAYRWDQGSQRWIPLLDWIGWDDWGWTGVVSMATDPVDPDRVYAAVGTYTNDWDPNNGAVLRSADRGATWQVSPLPFKQGGNMPGRGMGERLAIDPNDNSVLYLGTPEGNGLWRSLDFGATWAEVASFPNPGNWSEDPGDASGYLSHQPGVVWVTFDPRTGTPGSATQTIYVGVADLDNTVYHSTDGGATWQRLAGQPAGYLAQKGVLDHDGGYLYLATSDNGGPYAGCSGEVWRYDTAGGTWTDITPQRDDCWFGYSGLTVDRQQPDTIMVTGYSAWWPDTFMFRSTDNGETWGRMWDFGAEWPNRDNRYTLDISASPWLTFGTSPELPEQSPKLGWMTQGMEIDPHNSDRFLYGTGATIYGAENLTAFDTGGTVDIRVMAQGLEETSIQDLISPPTGAHLISAVGDLGGFRHDDLDVAPDLMFQGPYFNNGRSLDYAELAPEIIVRVGQTDREGDTRFGHSTDGGQTWTPGTEPAGTDEGGTVAIAADGSRVVWSPGGAAVHWSDDAGQTWTASGGIPAGARVAADRVDPDTFYGFAAGTFYVSGDGGATFTASAATGLPPEGNVRFRAVPGHQGDIWLAGGAAGEVYGMWRSTDSGATFTPVAGVDEGDSVGFGKAAPGQSYPAIYTSSRIDGVRGIFRSDDAGATWLRINDDEHQWAWTGATITGDPRVFGRVYVGTNGRGIIYGDVVDTAPPGCQVQYLLHGQWPGGFIAQVIIRNTAAEPITGWTLDWSFGGAQQIDQIWGATATQTGASVSADSLSWNALIRPGKEVTFGFTGTSSGPNPVPESFVLNGRTCAG